eukprot:CAMPEP_0113882936 /NCGR_PEP_ID=MMETSP0780_2-20120614/9274_1 /TAXON_ID=652834 /ORGANISM="Palpitomonas bilix" /LENGTH=657 /DNA_ID=CAMNT_0000870091 /DNA_START=1592 /DNA_END=3563 /DNA_ORIENTATION=- /assembly_acc=CAM_ASM_000599
MVATHTRTALRGKPSPDLEPRPLEADRGGLETWRQTAPFRDIGGPLLYVVYVRHLGVFVARKDARSISRLFRFFFSIEPTFLPSDLFVEAWKLDEDGDRFCDTFARVRNIPVAEPPVGHKGYEWWSRAVRVTERYVACFRHRNPFLSQEAPCAYVLDLWPRESSPLLQEDEPYLTPREECLPESEPREGESGCVPAPAPAPAPPSVCSETPYFKCLSFPFEIARVDDVQINEATGDIMFMCISPGLSACATERWFAGNEAFCCRSQDSDRLDEKGRGRKVDIDPLTETWMPERKLVRLHARTERNQKEKEKEKEKIKQKDTRPSLPPFSIASMHGPEWWTDFCNHWWPHSPPRPLASGAQERRGHMCLFWSFSWRHEHLDLGTILEEQRDSSFRTQGHRSSCTPSRPLFDHCFHSGDVHVGSRAVGQASITHLQGRYYLWCEHPVTSRSLHPSTTSLLVVHPKGKIQVARVFEGSLWKDVWRQTQDGTDACLPLSPSWKGKKSCNQEITEMMHGECSGICFSPDRRMCWFGTMVSGKGESGSVQPCLHRVVFDFSPLEELLLCASKDLCWKNRFPAASAEGPGPCTVLSMHVCSPTETVYFGRERNGEFCFGSIGLHASDNEDHGISDPHGRTGERWTTREAEEEKEKAACEDLAEW